MGTTGNEESPWCIKRAKLEVCPKHMGPLGITVIVHYNIECDCEDELYGGGDGSDGDIPGSITGHDDGIGQCMKMTVEQTTHQKCGPFWNRNCTGEIEGVIEISGIRISRANENFALLFMECFMMKKMRDAKACIQKKLSDPNNRTTPAQWEESFQQFKDDLLGRDKGGNAQLQALFYALSCSVAPPDVGLGGGPPIQG